MCLHLCDDYLTNYEYSTVASVLTFTFVKFVISPFNIIRPSKKFVAQDQAIITLNFLLSLQAVLHAHHARESVRIADLVAILDSKTGSVTKNKPRCLIANQSALIEVRRSNPVNPCGCSFLLYANLNRELKKQTWFPLCFCIKVDCHLLSNHDLTKQSLSCRFMKASSLGGNRLQFATYVRKYTNLLIFVLFLTRSSTSSE